MTLTATSRPRRRSRARYTVAMPPWPISAMSSYFSSSGLRPERAVNRAPSVAAHTSRQLLHSHRVRCTAHADARSVHHHVALTRFDEAIVGQDLAGALHLFFEVGRRRNQRARRDAPI